MTQLNIKDETSENWYDDDGEWLFGYDVTLEIDEGYQVRSPEQECEEFELPHPQGVGIPTSTSPLLRQTP